MTRQELITLLKEFEKRFSEEDQSKKIEELESHIRYYEHTNKQQESKILKMESLLAEIRNISSAGLRS